MPLYTTVVRQQLAYQPALEPERSEWFVRGTEAAVVALVEPAQRMPKILYPVQASILAIDPD